MTTFIQANTVAELIACLNHPEGPRGRMRDLEMERGRTEVQPSKLLVFPYTLQDFDEDTLLTREGNDIRIVIVNVRHPGKGAFGRLVRGISAAGLNPVVVAPVGPHMPAILAKWGWVQHIIGIGFERENLWRPK